MWRLLVTILLSINLLEIANNCASYHSFCLRCVTVCHVFHYAVADQNSRKATKEWNDGKACRARSHKHQSAASQGDRVDLSGWTKSTRTPISQSSKFKDSWLKGWSELDKDAERWKQHPHSRDSHDLGKGSGSLDWRMHRRGGSSVVPMLARSIPQGESEDDLSPSDDACDRRSD